MGVFSDADNTFRGPNAPSFVVTNDDAISTSVALTVSLSDIWELRDFRMFSVELIQYVRLGNSLARSA